MKRRAHAKRHDAAEPAIVAAIRACGFTVILLDGPVDLLVGGRGQTWLLEVKSGDLAPSARPLTPDEADFFAHWRGAPPAIVRCTEEALCVLLLAGCRRWNDHRASPCGCGSIDDPAWLRSARGAKTLRP